MDIRRKWTGRGNTTDRKELGGMGKAGQIGVRLEWTGIIFLGHLHVLTMKDYT
jgi:ribosomal protein L15